MEYLCIITLFNINKKLCHCALYNTVVIQPTREWGANKIWLATIGLPEIYNFDSRLGQQVGALDYVETRLGFESHLRRVLVFLTNIVSEGSTLKSIRFCFFVIFVFTRRQKETGVDLFNRSILVICRTLRV